MRTCHEVDYEIIGDDMQHLGQAAYVRGLYERLS